MMSRLSFAVLATAALPLLAGCAMNSTATSASLTDSGSLHVQGTIHGGQQALYHARMQLYQVGQGTVAGAPGYAANAVPLITASVYSAANGSFSITGDYSCTTGSQVYLTASGGSVDGNIADSNPNIAMMAALGSCSSLLANAATAFVSVNEISTVASAYALAQFSGNSAFGTALSTQPGTASVKPADNFATSSSNSTGLSNAMATAQVIADYYSPTGAPTGFAPGKNTNGSAVSEYWTVNTIANILAACINSGVTTLSTAGDGTICGTLYTYTTPSGKTAPADTLQAALYMALYPGDSNLLSGTYPGKNLTNLITATPPFQPYVAPDGNKNVINDWTIAINYTPVATNTSTTLISEPYNTVVDSVGNVWTDNINPSGNSFLLEVDPTGNPILAGATSCHTSTCATTDYQVNAFRKPGATSNNKLGAEPGTSSNTEILALDPSNNVWFTDRKNAFLVFFEGSGNGSVSNGGSNYSSASITSIGSGYSVGTDVTMKVDGTGQPWFVINNATNVNSSCKASITPSSTLGTIVGATTTIGSGTTASPTTYGTGGVITYGGGGGSGSNTMAIDAGNPSCTAGSTTTLCNSTAYDVVSGSSTPITGSPFVWTIANSGVGSADKFATTNAQAGAISQFYTSAGGLKNDGTSYTTTGLGCETAVGQITSADAPVANQTQTLVPSFTSSGDTFYFAVAPKNPAFGPGGKLWLSSNNPMDSNSTVVNGIISFTPNYGSPFNYANFSATSSTTGQDFNVYTGGGLGSTLTMYGLSVDGAGSPWASGSVSTGTQTPAVHLSATGSPLSPSTGFLGTTYSNGTTTLTRVTGTTNFGSPGIDPSGNVWMPDGDATSTSIYELVGAATPVVTPISLGIKNGTLGMMP